MIKSTNVSYLISLLRFPMIVGVVFIHATIVSYAENLGLLLKDMPVFYIVNGVLGDGICKICVPLFFFISGFLFFYRTVWDSKMYFRKLKRRLHSLLIPYLFFNLFGIIIFACLQQLIPSMQSGAHIPIMDWSMTDFFNAFWRREGEGIPFVGPLWFIRNLMVVCLISPIIFYFVSKCKFWGIFLLGVLWFTGWKEFSIPGMQAVFFFSLGSYFSIHNNDFICVCNKYIICAVLLFIFSLITHLVVFQEKILDAYVIRVLIVSGLVSVISFFNYLVLVHNVTPNKVLLSATFFVFAIHEPYQDQFKKIIFQLMPISDNHIIVDLQFTFVYILFTIIYIAVIVILFKILARYLPHFVTVICGGR